MANQRKWNPVPGVQQWGTSVSPRSSVIAKFPEATQTDSKRVRLPSRTRNLSRNYYDVAEEVQSEEEMGEWLKEDRKHGALRVYQPSSTYSDLIKCTDLVTAETVMSKCVATELYIDYAGQSLEPLAVDSKPLEIQKKFLKSLGYIDHLKIQQEGMHKELASLFKFVAGKETKATDKVQLTCTVKYKELGAFGFWSKRFCVLCGPKLYIFSSSKPKGKPSTILDLANGVITEQADKKHLYCIQVATIKKIVLLSFTTRLDQSIWLKKAEKVVTMHPHEADLSRCSLDQVPQYLFLNKDLIALNLSHNFMYEIEEANRPKDTLGFVNDLHQFQSLKILSLSNNNLFHFPLSICTIVSLTELDLSCNRIANIPKEIKNLKNLSTLLLHSNLLSSLPYPLNELHRLTTLVVAYNRFKLVPHIVKELQSLRILILAGNRITNIPEDIQRIQTLQVFDMRLNQVDSELPSTMSNMPSFFSINLHGNRLRDFDMRRAKNLHVINISDNNITSLSLLKGKMKMLNARNNKITKMIIPSVPGVLMSLDLSRNELSLLPESLAQCTGLEKLILSRNKLTTLPKNLLKMLKRLSVLQVDNNSLYQLPPVGENCALQNIDIHCNKVKKLPDALFLFCPRLESLNISGNPISTLPLTKRPMRQQLQYLDTGKARQQQPLSFKLTELKAANCALTSNAIDSILSFKRLKTLHLAYNSIERVPPHLFTLLPQLEYLNLGSNGIKTIQSPNHGSPHLTCLILHSNNLKTLPAFPIMPLVESLDLSCNDLNTLANLNRFIRLKTLDISFNTKLCLDSHEVHNIRFTDNIIARGIPNQTIQAISAQNSKFKLTEDAKKSKKFIYSLGESKGTGLEKTKIISTKTIAMPVFKESENDALFGLIDGGKVPDAAEKIQSIMAETLRKEIIESSTGDVNHPLLYLEHAFLSVHRDLGPIGLKHGASMVLCHIVKKSNGDYILNTANTGLGEAILCTGSQVTALTNPHNPATNKSEATRVAQEKGFISEDDRVNGVCGVSRLLGCYYLYPQVIPLPSTKSITLPPYTSFLIIATHGLWKYVTQKEIYKCIRSFRDPASCSKRLAELAVAGGCPLDVYVIVVKIVLGEDLVDSKNVVTSLSYDATSIDMIEEEEAQEVEMTMIEDNLMTNIDDDDLMEESFVENIQPVKDKSYLKSAGLKVISPDQLDALVNRDMVIEDLVDREVLSEDEDNELVRDGSFVNVDSESDENDQILNRSSKSDQKYNIMASFDKQASNDDINTDNSSDDESVSSIEYQQANIKLAKSVPEIKAEYESQFKDGGTEVNPSLRNINTAISNIDDEDMTLEEEEQLQKQAQVKRKKSFVQSSYNRLSRHAFDTGTSFHSL